MLIFGSCLYSDWRHKYHNTSPSKINLIIYVKGSCHDGGSMAALDRISAQDEVYDFLLSQPTPQDIVRFKPSVETQEHLRALLEANRSGTLTALQKAELEAHIHTGHFMRMLKIRARQTLEGK